MNIAVYGASGYQATLVRAELSRRELVAVPVTRREATTTDHEALVAAFSGCAAVINCAGPFTDTGVPVLRAALAAGCHYVDTAGEQRYLKSVFDTLGAEAAAAGVTAVPAANDGCVPGDLLAHLLAGRLPAVEEMIVSHTIAGGGAPSRGSLKSAQRTMSDLAGGGLTYLAGDWHEGVPPGRTRITFPDADTPTEMARLPLPEVVTIPRHVPVGRVESLVAARIAAALTTPLPALDALPDGPTPEERRDQRFTYVVDATAADGTTLRGVVTGVDTYGTTAVIAVELACRLAVDGAKPGVLAPAEAVDAAGFLDSLAPHGIRWRITEPTS